MTKRLDIYPEDAKKPKAGSKERETPAERRLHQDLTLSKGERQKGSSPAYAIGKVVERHERKGA